MQYGSISLQINSENQKAPSEIVLVPSGDKITGRDGRTFLNSNPNAVAERTLERKVELPIDENHSTDQLMWTPCPALGWIKNITINKVGELIGIVEWNSAGQTLIENRQYRYISPVFVIDPGTREIQYLVGAGLTNRPNLELPALNSEQKNNQKKELYMKRVLNSLGLSEDASEDAALTEIEKLKNRAVSTNSVDLSLYAPRSDVKMLEERALNSERKLEQLRQEDLERRADELVTNAMKMGKIAPASKEAYLSLCSSEEGLVKCNAILEASAPVLNNQNLVSNAVINSDGNNLNSIDDGFIQSLGYTRDEWKKVEEAAK